MNTYDHDTFIPFDCGRSIGKDRQFIGIDPNPVAATQLVILINSVEQNVPLPQFLAADQEEQVAFALVEGQKKNGDRSKQDEKADGHPGQFWFAMTPAPELPYPADRAGFNRFVAKPSFEIGGQRQSSGI